MPKFIIYADGGSRGNPGPAAIGVVIKDAKEKTLKKYGENVGIKTNNEAEYESVIFGLKKIKQLIGGKESARTEVELRLDSELVASQLNGKFKITEKNLAPLFIKVWNLKTDFKNASFLHIPRNQNKEADRLVNQALDNKENARLF